MDGDIIEDIVNGIAAIFKLAAILLLIFIPLGLFGLWKLIELMF